MIILIILFKLTPSTKSFSFLFLLFLHNNYGILIVQVRHWSLKTSESVM